MLRKPKPKPKPDNPEQLKRFIDMAREVEADESPEALDRAFNKVIPSRSALTHPLPEIGSGPRKLWSDKLEKLLRILLPQ
jgi:hypothetical protein